MNGKRKWTLVRIQQNIPLFERLTSSPLTREERGEGDQGFQRPLTRSQVGNFTTDDKSTNVLLSSPASSRGLGLVLIVMIIVTLAFAGLARVGSAAEDPVSRELRRHRGLPASPVGEQGIRVQQKVRRRSGNHFNPGRLAEHSGLGRREPSIDPDRSLRQ